MAISGLLSRKKLGRHDFATKLVRSAKRLFLCILLLGLRALKVASHAMPFAHEKTAYVETLVVDRTTRVLHGDQLRMLKYT